MIQLLPKIEKANQDNIHEIYFELVPHFLKEYIIHDKLSLNYDEFINNYLSKNLLNFQLCFSNMRCLNCFEVVDIINLDKEVYDEK